jgi:hypothetical protein
MDSQLFRRDHFEVLKKNKKRTGLPAVIPETGAEG